MQDWWVFLKTNWELIANSHVLCMGMVRKLFNILIG
jgi:hypothetical protein